MKQIVLWSAISIALAAGLAACGKDNSGSSNVGVPTTIYGYPYGGANFCPAGQFYTYYGCLPQGNCPAGQAQTQQGQCIPQMPVTNSGYNPGYYGGYGGGYGGYPYGGGGYYGGGYGGYPYGGGYGGYYGGGYGGNNCKQGSWYWYCY